MHTHTHICGIHICALKNLLPLGGIWEIVWESFVPGFEDWLRTTVVRSSQSV